MTAHQFLNRLKEFIDRKYVSVRAAARAWECSDTFVHMVLKGDRKPSFIMLEDMGFERVESVDYKRVRK